MKTLPSLTVTMKLMNQCGQVRACIHLCAAIFKDPSHLNRDAFSWHTLPQEGITTRSSAAVCKNGNLLLLILNALALSGTNCCQLQGFALHSCIAIEQYSIKDGHDSLDFIVIEITDVSQMECLTMEYH